MGDKAQLLAVLLIHLCLAVSADYEFYVSVDGSDLWDGSAEANVDGSDVGPWKTLNHAVNEIRKAREHSTHGVRNNIIFFNTPSASPNILPSVI